MRLKAAPGTCAVIRSTVDGGRTIHLDGLEEHTAVNEADRLNNARSNPYTDDLFSVVNDEGFPEGPRIVAPEFALERMRRGN